MGVLVAAYLIVWLAVVLYVVRLGAGQRQLRRALEALQSQFGRSQDPGNPTSTAA